MTKRIAGIALMLAVAACDPVPVATFTPPGGFEREPSLTGRAAVRAVLFTPSHGSFRTVREALTVYMARSTEAVQVHGWIAEGVTASSSPYYRVAFSWNDGRRERAAEWELDNMGVWPMNTEARVLTVFPPSGER